MSAINAIAGQSRNGPRHWGERWTKVYESALTDTKYLAIAAKTGAPRLLIAATFTELLLYTGSHHPDTGSIEGFDVRVWATWAEASVELVERVIKGLREFGLLAGNIIANWTKRQGQKIIAADEKIVSATALRQRRCRARKAEARKAEDLNPETHDPGGASHASSKASPSVTPGVTEGVTDMPESVTSGVTCHVTVTVEEEEGEALRERKQVFKKGDNSSGRDAPLGEPQQPSENVVRLSDSDAAKKAALRAELKGERWNKVIRFIHATYADEEHRRRMHGMLGLDTTHDEQWWFDHCDAEMRRANWDDVRDRRRQA